MYAIRKKDTHRWYYGTDHKFTPPRAKTSRHIVRLFNTYEEAKAEKPNDDDEEYEIVGVGFRILEEHIKLRDL